MAGVKGKSGRKSNKELAQARELIDKAVTRRQWLAIFKRLASSKDVRAAQLLMAYRFGLPTQIVAGDSDAPPIRIIEVVRPAKRGK